MNIACHWRVNFPDTDLQNPVLFYMNLQGVEEKILWYLALSRSFLYLPQRATPPQRGACYLRG